MIEKRSVTCECGGVITFYCRGDEVVWSCNNPECYHNNLKGDDMGEADERTVACGMCGGEVKFYRHEDGVAWFCSDPGCESNRHGVNLKGDELDEHIRRERSKEKVRLVELLVLKSLEGALADGDGELALRLSQVLLNLQRYTGGNS